MKINISYISIYPNQAIKIRYNPRIDKTLDRPKKHKIFPGSLEGDDTQKTKNGTTKQNAASGPKQCGGSKRIMS
jgi:hypothetical protein